ncbi:TonB-dependent receptor [Flexithrix dorotheae]|uniref:TonB-dependent receptor n=1 Tax=Flexithrix dorotheae TaxID=70993 RepID=UPI0003662C42|nr:TonB-dependent receptor [Flexithrix dorotheae]
MKQLYYVIFLTTLFFSPSLLLANDQPGVITGTVQSDTGEPLVGITALLEGTSRGAVTDVNGHFEIKEVAAGNYTLVVSGIGYIRQNQAITISSGQVLSLSFALKENTEVLSEVVVKSEKTAVGKLEGSGFSVKAVETKELKTQSMDMHRVLDRTAGVRVRQSGGMGSDFTYSLDGMSGNAIRFFIDGIPMDYFGSSYSINNIPIALIDRIDVYKGVVAAELGSDALGGAINLVTNQNISNFVDASYSFGSYNTHRAALHGQWRLKSGFTTKLSTFYTYSDNNYKVWGKGVHYADASTGFKAQEFTKENPAERFNDDFQTISAKFDIGFSQKKWADQFFISLLASDQKKGVQTAQTMSHVYGEMRNNEQVLMPSISYKKSDLFTEGLDVNIFAGYSYTEGVLVDTTTMRYDWRGEQIGTNPSGGEMGRNGKSLFTQKDNSNIVRFNTTYQLPYDFTLGLNYLYSSTKRSGEDPFTPVYRTPYIEPQGISTHFAGLSLETIKFDGKLHANAFLKYYDYSAHINDLVYTTEWEIIEHKNNVVNWGGGFAASYKLFPKLMIKASAEQATRMPSPTEALGDGVTIRNNPNIEPEQSFNTNIGAVLGRYRLGYNNGVKIALTTFYRNVTDQLLFTITDGQGNGIFENIRKIAGTGGEIDMIFDFDQKLKFTLNGTYLDFRNNLKIDENGRENIVYGDRVRNKPYFMANAGLEYTVMDFIQKDAKFFTYFQSGYVHQFFLRWPSLGNQDNKDIIPTQLVFDAGIGYTFPSKKLILAIDVSNLFNEQVYDNYLLQKPGRAIFFKINYQIKSTVN